MIDVRRGCHFHPLRLVFLFGPAEEANRVALLITNDVTFVSHVMVGGCGSTIEGGDENVGESFERERREHINQACLNHSPHLKELNCHFFYI